MNAKELKFYETIIDDPEKARLIHKIFKKEIKKFAKAGGYHVYYVGTSFHYTNGVVSKITTKIEILRWNGWKGKMIKPKIMLSGVSNCHPTDEFNHLIGTVLAEHRLVRKIRNVEAKN